MSLIETRTRQVLSPRSPYNEIEISVVLPCLNESATLAGCIRQAQAVIQLLDAPGEIIVADNGSTDGSQQIAADLGACVVDVPRPGYGSALIQGCRAASGKYVIIADSDASYDLFDAIPMIEMLQNGTDMVIGSRMRGKIYPGAMPWLNRYIGNPCLTTALNILFHAGVSDAHCGIRAFRRDAFLRMDLRSTGMEFASEMIVKATLWGLRREESPVTYRPDGRNRPPHLRPWRDGWRHLRFLLLYSPSWLFFLPGLLLSTLGVILNTILSLMPEPANLTFGRVFFGTHWTIPATLSATFGLQIIFLGIITLKYSVQRRLYPEPGWFTKISKRISLESILVLGTAMGMIGVGIEASILIRWIASGFGELTEFRLAVFGLMWILLGAEAVFNSFVLGLLSHEAEILPSMQ